MTRSSPLDPAAASRPPCSLIMFSEQAFLNAGPLITRGLQGAAAAGFIFNVLMLARAPLQLFQSVSTSILPHLTKLHTPASPRRASANSSQTVRMVLLGIAAFTALVVVVVLIAGPKLMQIAFSKKFTYDREGLLLVSVGMGLYLCSVTVNQACIAQGQVRRAAARWITCAALFIGWNFVPLVSNEFRRVEIGFLLAAGVLFSLLYYVYRRPHERAEDVPDAGLRRGARGAPGDDRRERLTASTRVRSMGGHDAELILIAGALLAAGIVGALLADRMRIPGLLIFLALGMLAGSEGIGGIEFNDTELARTLGTIALVLILFEGGLTAGWSEIRPVLGTAASLATVGTTLTALVAGLAAKLDLRAQHPRGDAGRRRPRRHRLGRDLRRPAPLAAGEAAGPLARGRVGDERPGRAAAGDRLHRMDPAARLRHRRHGRAAGAQTGRRHRGRRPGARQARGRGARPGAAADRRHLPGGDDRDRRPRLRPRRGRARLRAARHLPDRAGARLGQHPGPPHRRRLPRGGRLGRPDRPLHPARAARLPQQPRRRRARRAGALGGR